MSEVAISLKGDDDAKELDLIPGQEKEFEGLDKITDHYFILEKPKNSFTFKIGKEFQDIIVEFGYCGLNNLTNDDTNTCRREYTKIEKNGKEIENQYTATGKFELSTENYKYGGFIIKSSEESEATYSLKIEQTDKDEDSGNLSNYLYLNVILLYILFILV